MLNNHNDLAPPAFFGTAPEKFDWPEINWLLDLPKNTFFALWQRLPFEATQIISLPLGHDLYVVSFHMEMFDERWIIREANRVGAPVIVLNDSHQYNYVLPDNVFVYTYYSWHYQIQQIIDLFPTRQPKTIEYKTSAICNRITQSKLLIFTALMETLGAEQCLVKLGSWLEEKNVHYRNSNGSPVLDNLAEIFYNKYYGNEIVVDEFNQKSNTQRFNGDPWSKFYTNVALHFSLESYHYSQMNDTGITMNRPGPHLSEKTLKCLIAGTAFIPVAQFDVYGSLSKLGLKFDYGSINTGFDNDPGNITRLVKIVQLINSLKELTSDDILSVTQDSTDHNTHHVWSGGLQKQCVEHNHLVAQNILTKFSK
jgi:hypothetical protein